MTSEALGTASGERSTDGSGREARTTAAPRARAPLAIGVFTILLVAATLTLTTLNGSFASDPVFIPLAIAMVLGYSTVGAVLASRTPKNPMGWLMMVVGIAFLISGLADEYVTYTYQTNPGSLPFGGAAAVVSGSFWLPTIAALVLLVLLFPSGRVPGPRWRYLPRAVGGLTVLFFLANTMAPGILPDTAEFRIENPFGVQALKPVVGAVVGITSIAVLLSAILAVVALVLRFRRSRQEERQQIRWLVYVVATIMVVIVIAILAGLIVGSSFGESILSNILFFVIFTLIGIGVPAAMGVAVLKYRLYDLDLVVQKTVLYAIVAVVLTAVFLVVAVAIGGATVEASPGAVLAAVALGVSIWPALRLARRIADRVVYGRRATPYEVLAEFSARVGSSYGAEDVLPRMARILAEAVGARRAIVWLRIGGELRPAAVAPDGEIPGPIRMSGDELPGLPVDAVVEVRDGGELLGALSVDARPNDPMNSSKDRLVRDLASQAGLVLRNVRLIEELRESRRRIVAAQDERARKLERNIHDGAQQQLVALAVKIGLAEQLTERDPARSKEMLAQLRGEVKDALENLRDLARGIYPPLLADAGLGAALEAQARKSPVAVEFGADGIGRYRQEVEAAVYFCVLEAMQNIAKYSEANRARIRLAEASGDLTFTVVDDGVGFDPSQARGSGLPNMRDRMEALGGRVEVRSSVGSGTAIIGLVPVRSLEATRS
jgi:signal transduction histidine kinase